MKRFFLLAISFLLIVNLYCEEELKPEYNLLPWEAWDGYLNGTSETGTPVNVYKPYPVIFIHGFAGGDADTWNNIVTASLSKYYDPYTDYALENNDPIYPNDKTKFTLLIDDDVRVPYLERMDMKDKNGSVDTYNTGDEINLENEQGNSEGWADKLKRSIDYLIDQTKAEKVILVCHSMGGLAAREYIANEKYGDPNENIDRVITISTPHAGTPLAKSATNLGRFYRHGWNVPGPGVVLIVLIVPIKIFLQTFHSVDISGEAVRDMTPNKLEGAPSTPGSVFLENLGKHQDLDDPDIYTIIASDGSKLPILLAENKAIAQEPTDGAVPVQSQRGIPFVRDSKDGVYLLDSNGNILTQSRMFSNPDKIDEEDFYDPSKFLYDPNKILDIEKQITAPHGGDNGAPFVAAGLEWKNGKAVSLYNPRNYILSYLDYQKPVLTIIDKVRHWPLDTNENYVGEGSYTHFEKQDVLLVGINNVLLPTELQAHMITYLEDNPDQIVSDRMIYYGSQVGTPFRPIENTTAYRAGCYVKLNPSGPISYQAGVYINEISLFNVAGIESEPIYFKQVAYPSYLGSTAIGKTKYLYHSTCSTLNSNEYLWGSPSSWNESFSYYQYNTEKSCGIEQYIEEYCSYYKYNISGLKKISSYADNIRLKFFCNTSGTGESFSMNIYETESNWDAPTGNSYVSGIGNAPAIVEKLDTVYASYTGSSGGYWIEVDVTDLIKNAEPDEEYKTLKFEINASSLSWQQTGSTSKKSIKVSVISTAYPYFVVTPSNSFCFYDGDNVEIAGA